MGEALVENGRVHNLGQHVKQHPIHVVHTSSQVFLVDPNTDENFDGYHREE